MDEEELGSTGKKITINNFFESIKSVDKISQRALKFSKKSTEELKVATETLKGLQAIVQSLQIDVESLKESEQIRKNEEEDRRFKEEDAQQKKDMIERAEAVKGEKGEKGEEGEKGEDGSQEEPKKMPEDKGLFNTLFGGIVGAGAIGLGSILKLTNPTGGGPLGRLFGQGLKRDQVTKTTDKDTPVTSFAKRGGVAGFLNRKLFGGGKDKESEEKKEIKNEIKSEIKQELNIKEDTKDIKPEKKENKLMNFVKQGGVAGFLGRKIFGKKKNKAQEVGATKPDEKKDTSYSESFSYKGRFDPRTLEFIPDEGSLPPGVPLEKAQQDVYKSKIEMLEFDFRSNIREGMTREDAIKSYGPQSNLYRFKENYNKTLEFGGYELDVGKHYDSIKNSYSDKKKGKGQDSSLKGEKRGFKGVVGGVADSLTGGVFDFDKRGDSKIQRVGKGFIDALSGNMLDFDKKGGKPSGVMRNLTGMADFFTANMFDLDQRGSLFGDKNEKGNKKKLRDKDGRYIGDNARKKNFQKEIDSMKEKASVIPMDTTVNPDGSITSKGSGTVIGDELFTPGQPLTENQKMRIQIGLSMGNTYSEEIMKSYNMETVKSEKSIKPVIESDQKDLSNNIYQEIDNVNTTVGELVASNAQSESNSSNANLTPPVTSSNTSEAEVKTSKPNIPFIDLLKNKTKKEFALSSDGSGGYIS